MFDVSKACLCAHLLPHFWAVNSDAMGRDWHIPHPCRGIGGWVNPVKRTSRSQDPIHLSQDPLGLKVMQKAKGIENRIKLLIREP